MQIENSFQMTTTPWVNPAIDSPYNADRAKRYLWDEVNCWVDDMEFTEACFKVIHDPKFIGAAASREKHHIYPGGLAVHTAEVVRYCLVAADAFPDHRIDRTVLVTAAVYHDYMKVREYPEGYGEQEKAYRNLVRHVAGSHAAFLKNIGPDATADQVLQIEHCILAHHGRQEWGSPVEPQTLEAMILHQADMLSCQYGPGAR